MLSGLGEGGDAVVLMQQALERGFNPYRVLRSSDSAWNAVRAHPAYPPLLDAARTKYQNARQAFIDAGGERLLGVTVPLE
jgi:hypothetical protein